MIIPDNSVVEARIIRPQRIGVVHAELQKYLKFIGEHSRTIGDAALLTSMLLGSSNERT
jgi:hypothetical protein